MLHAIMIVQLLRASHEYAANGPSVGGRACARARSRRVNAHVYARCFLLPRLCAVVLAAAGGRLPGEESTEEGTRRVRLARVLLLLLELHERGDGRRRVQQEVADVTLRLPHEERLGYVHLGLVPARRREE
jgi:hypothetical protein